MGKIVPKRMRLTVTVRLYDKTWDRVITDDKENVIWKDLDRKISENETAIQGLAEWVDQMKQIPHWNIVETDIKMLDYKDDLEAEDEQVLCNSTEKEILEEAGVVLDDDVAADFFDEEELEEELEEEVLDDDDDDDDDDDTSEILMQLLAELAKKKKKKKKKKR